MSPEDRADIHETIARELRAIGLLECDRAPSLPPPADFSAERQVVADALCGAVRAGDLPVAPEDFSLAHLGRVFAACVLLGDAGLVPDLDAIADALGAEGFRTLDAETLEELRNTVPFRGRDATVRAARRVRELARARELDARLQRLSARLRSGAVGFDGAVAALGKYLAGRTESRPAMRVVKG